MKKKFGWKILFIVVFCVVFIIGFLLMNSINSYTRAIKYNWGIDLPTTCAKKIFEYSEPSFLGDGIRYHVIGYPIGNENKSAQNTVLQLEKVFLDSLQPTEAQIRYVERLLEHIDIYEDAIPD